MRWDKRIGTVLLLLIGLLKLPAPYPYALSLSTSEVDPGATVKVVISALATDSVKLTADDLKPTLPTLYAPETYGAEIQVPPECVCRGAVRTVRLWINGVDVVDAHLRVSGYSVWLPSIWRST